LLAHFSSETVSHFFLPPNFLTFAGLHENNEELQAQMLNKGLEEGRTLLMNQAHNNSLAAEFKAMSENEVRFNFCLVYLKIEYDRIKDKEILR
jgi:hypothetical protein